LRAIHDRCASTSPRRAARTADPAVTSQPRAGTVSPTWVSGRPASSSRAMVKLGARDRAQLVVFAVREGLAVPGPGT
jgi:hypothetical protein